MVWDNTFDSNKELCVETEDGDTIYITANGAKFGFDSRAPTEHELQLLPHVHLTSKFQWNPDTVQLEEVRANTFKAKYIAWQCKELGDTEKGGYKYQDPKSDESILHSINSVLVDLGSKMKRRLCSIATPAVSDIPSGRTFVSYSPHLKACTELISDLWCIGNKKSKATLEATTQQGTISDILPLSHSYRAGVVYSSKRLNARFATYTLFSDIKSLNQNVCAQVFSHKVGLSEAYPMQSGSGGTLRRHTKISAMTTVYRSTWLLM